MARRAISAAIARIFESGTRLDRSDRFNAGGRRGSAFRGGSDILVEASRPEMHLHLNENSPARQRAETRHFYYYTN